MALADVERLLTRLVTDAEFRDQVLAGSPGNGCEAAREALGDVPPDQFRRYAEALVSKRRHAVARCLPATARGLGKERFSELFRRHSAEFWPTGSKRHRDDAIAFADRIVRGAREGHPRWLLDVAAYESTLLRAQDPARRLLAVRVGHHPGALVNAIMTGRPGDEVVRAPSLVVWIRLRRGGDQRVFRVSMPRLSRGRRPANPPRG